VEVQVLSSAQAMKIPDIFRGFSFDMSLRAFFAKQSYELQRRLITALVYGASVVA